MSAPRITKTYLRLRTVTALTLIILAAIAAHLVGHASQGQIEQKAAVNAALDKAQLSIAEIIINLRELNSTDTPQRAGEFRAEIRRADRKLLTAYQANALIPDLLSLTHARMQPKRIDSDQKA